MYPGKKPCLAGPYNQAHGERLLAVYEQHDLTKGRVMLVDHDLVSYFMSLNSRPEKSNHASILPRVMHNHTGFLNDFERIALMDKERVFEKVFTKNTTTSHPLTKNILQDINPQISGLSVSAKSCYCQIEVSRNVCDMKKEFGKDYVRCSYRKCEFGNIFHKQCVKKLGFEKVSRWYCTACEKQMKVKACEALGISYKDEDLEASTANRMADKKDVNKF